MSKLSYEDKVEIYEKRKNGTPMSMVIKEYKVNRRLIQYLVRLIDKHGFDILRTTKNNYYPPGFKQEAIDRVLKNNESIWSVSIDIGLKHQGTLSAWIKKYKENGYNIVERKKGRQTMNKNIKTKKKENENEELIRLRKENEYLKAEIEYSKKLRAVVQARKNQQQKKK